MTLCKILCYYVGMSDKSKDHDKNGRFVAGHSHVITTQNAAAYQIKGVAARRANGRDAVRAAFAQGKDVTDMNVIGGAQLIAETLFEISTNTKNKDAATKPAALLWKMAGYFDKEERITIPGPAGSLINAPISSALSILQALDRAELDNVPPAEQSVD